MKKIQILATLTMALAFAPSAGAADYTVDASHSHVGFTVRHMVGKVKGEFKEFEGSFSFDPQKASEAKGTFEVKVASLSTNNEKRDAHLKGPEFFDVTKYPEMKLANMKTSSVGEKKYKMEGDLTLHGITKSVTFDLEFNGTEVDPWGGHRAGFTATAQIDRKDYGLIWNRTLESGGLLVGEKVDIELQVEALEGTPAAAETGKKAENKKESKKSGNKKPSK